MKQFLIITSQSEKTVGWKERAAYVQEFCDTLQAHLDDFKVSFTTYQNLEFQVVGGELSITDTRNDLNLKDVNFVHFKNWAQEREDAATLAFYLEQLGIPFFNSEVNSGLATGKIAQMVRLAHAGLPVPDTLYAHRKKLIERFKNGLPEGFEYPLIMKANDGSKGDDNFLIKSAEEACEILESSGASDQPKEFVVQGFIPNEGDLRLLYIGLDSDPLIFKRVAAGDSHLNNTSQGGSGEFVTVDHLDQEILDQARLVAQTLHREISGVDLIFNKETGAHYFLEANTTPAIATGYGTEEKLKKFAAFVQNVEQTTGNKG